LLFCGSIYILPTSRVEGSMNKTLNG